MMIVYLFNRNSRKKPCLLNILQNKASRQDFYRFLKTEFSNENLEFWQDVEVFRLVKKKNLVSKATKIFSTYFNENSVKEVIYLLVVFVLL